MNSNDGLNSISFDMPKNQSNVIKVIGVGGGGSNAINHMFKQGIKGVDFVICNTDAQALENSTIPNRIQLGVSLTEGLGAGANPEVGEQAALESFEEIKNMLDVNTKMVFITAGMGGGTGTGAAPVIAKMSKELGILTVGIVTIPFLFEGKTRNEQAHIGVEKLRKEVDSLIVINNNKLREVYGNLGFKAGFSKADEVLATASRGIAEVITHHYTQNIDLRDAKTVLSNSGTAIMGSATASGAQRANTAISKALDSPLLNDNKITGAKNVLLLIVSGREEITIDEIGEINDFIQQEASHGANIIMGVGDDENLDDSISVTVIATGFNQEQQNDIVNTETKKIIHSLGNDQKVVQSLTNVSTSTASIPKKAASIEPTLTQPISETIVEKTPVVEKVEQKIETPIYGEPIIKHTLVEGEVEEVFQPRAKSIMKESEQAQEPVEIEPVTPTQPSEVISDIEDIKIIEREEEPVFTEESVAEDDFVIINSNEVDNDTIEEDNELSIEEEEDRQQMTFTFDLPLEKKNNYAEEVASVEEMTSNIVDDNDISLAQQQQQQQQQQQPSDNVVRYQLEEDEEKVAVDKKTSFEDEIEFERRTLETPEEEISIDEDADPVDMPISEVLKARASERRARMKDFNYKFRTSASQIDGIEKQPAYKRAGLELENYDTDTKISRTCKYR